ncbi:MAG: HAMP domain-containing sensor histidine kinase [Burkholderiales bacterium]
MTHAQRPRGMHHRMGRRFKHSLGLKLLLLFLLLALALGATFLVGMRHIGGNGWRALAEPLLHDYADRLVAEIGSPPDPARAEALAQRLHLRIRIDGPALHWVSSNTAPDDARGAPLGPRWLRVDGDEPEDADHGDMRTRVGHWALMRRSADGHDIRFGLAQQPWREPRVFGWLTLAALLLITAVAYAVLRRLMRPLGDIHAGALRFGQGDFSQPIPVRHSDELGRVAAQVNAMAASISQMLDAKRGLLLAISHELRSPLTRARLNVELLAPPADTEQTQAHGALLADLAQMRDLIEDLLESERLATGHASLAREPVDLAALVTAVVAELGASGQVVLSLDVVPTVQVDRLRLRLALRALIDNARRHSKGAAQLPSVALALADGQVVITVRDFGPGVPPEQLAQLGQAFYRPDSARTRSAGGVGLGLYLCRLVAQVHGGTLQLRNAEPGFEATLRLPLAAAETVRPFPAAVPASR